MRRVVIFLKEVVVPIAVAIILAAVFRNVYVKEDGCNFLYLWIIVGFSVRYHKARSHICSN